MEEWVYYYRTLMELVVEVDLWQQKQQWKRAETKVGDHRRRIAKNTL